MIDGSVLQSAQKCFEKKSRVVVKMVVNAIFYFAQNVALYNKNNGVLLFQALCVIGFLENLMFKLHISPRTTFSS